MSTKHFTMENGITNVQLQIGELAKRARVSIRTVRYYEEKGLLPASGHTSGGIRLYRPRDVNRLMSIRRLKTLGLNLEEIKMCQRTLPTDANRNLRVDYTLQLLRQQKNKLKEKIAELNGVRNEIEHSLEVVTGCLTCTAEKCPENCLNLEHIL